VREISEKGGRDVLEIEKVLKSLLNDEVDAVREEATKALGKFYARKKFPEFMGTLTSGKPEERLRVVYAAEEMGGDEGLKLLMRGLEDDADDVRGTAIRLLERYPRADVLKALVSRIPREKGYILGNLITVLGKSGRKEIAPILMKFVNHEDEEISARAIEAVGNVGFQESLKEILEKSTSQVASIRKAVASSLGSLPLSHGS